MTLPPLGKAKVVRGDARNIPLDDDSVDLIVTSPPYWKQRSYKDDGQHYEGQIGDEPTVGAYIDALIEATRDCMRVLKPTGSLWVNLGDKYGRGTRTVYPGRPTKTPTKSTTGSPAGSQKSLIGVPWRYALRCIDDLDLILRAEVIWNKTNGLPESVTDRVRRSHEQWFHFTLDTDYYAELDPIREPLVFRNEGKSSTFFREASSHDLVPGHSMKQHRTDRPNVPVGDPDRGRIPSSVWDVATEPLRVPEDLGITHYAAFPTTLPQRIIEGWCPPGGVVLDPFGGTGTTAMVAKALGRSGVTLDMSADYGHLAKWRTNDRDQLAKVRGRILKAGKPAKVEPPDENQLALFDGLRGGDQAL